MSYRDGISLTWQNGRELATYSQGNTSVNYTYDVDGLRTGKTVAVTAESGSTSTVKYTYVYEDGLLRQMSRGSRVYDFIYDAYGNPVSIAYRSRATANPLYYYYGTNSRGDVVSLYDSNGLVVALYEYDAYGKLLSIKNPIGGAITGDTNIAIINPLRYRGYVYDTETGLYYLQSRYYDPTTCRFVNEDIYYDTGIGLTGHNMFAYCNNNPIFYVDDFGTKPAAGMTAGGETPDEKIITYSRMNNRPVPTSDTGSAKNYNDMLDEYNQNCYTYAIQEQGICDPGEISGLYPSGYNNVNSVGISVVADMKYKGYSIREISGPNSKIYDNEYKIALRTGTYVHDIYGIYDYHFMVQTGTGQWAEKHGRFGPSELHDFGFTPETIPWILGRGPYYDSEILYYAISK